MLALTRGLRQSLLMVSPGGFSQLIYRTPSSRWWSPRWTLSNISYGGRTPRQLVGAFLCCLGPTVSRPSLQRGFQVPSAREVRLHSKLYRFSVAPFLGEARMTGLTPCIESGGGHLRSSMGILTTRGVR